jgi:hypothetical protein
MIAYEEWLGVLSSMWTAAGKPVDNERLAEYARTFNKIPHGLLRKMADRAIKDNGVFNTVPTIGACWVALRKELHNPYDLDAAIEEWSYNSLVMWTIPNRYEAWLEEIEMLEDAEL